MLEAVWKFVSGYWSSAVAVVAFLVSVASAWYTRHSAIGVRDQADAAIGNLPPIINLTPQSSWHHEARTAYFNLNIENQNKKPLELLKFEFESPAGTKWGISNVGTKFFEFIKNKPNKYAFDSTGTVLTGANQDGDHSFYCTFSVEMTDQSLITTDLRTVLNLTYRFLDGRQTVVREGRPATFKPTPRPSN